MELVGATFPAGPGMIPAVLDLADSVSGREGMDGAGRLRMRLNLEEVLLGLAEYAAPLERDPMVGLIIRREGDELVYSVRDKGLPFDYRALADEGHRDIASLLDRSGGVELRNLGRGGREQTFRLPVPPAVRQSPDGSSAGHAFTPDDFAIHRMRPEEGLEVTRCLYDEFGYSYINEAVYMPDRFAESVEQGSVIPYTSTAPDGEVAGFMALLRDPDLPGTAEMAMVVVKKRFRRLSIMNRLIANAIGEARSMGLSSVIMEPVAYHPYTQRVSDRFGMTPCALWLNKIPADMDTSYGDAARRSLFMSAKVLRDLPRRIHAPAGTEAMCRRILDGLGAERVFSEGSEPAGETVIAETVNSVMGTGRIYAERIGADCHDRLRRSLHGMRRLGCELVELAINLQDPAAPSMHGAARDLGFFNAGMLPAASDRDLLLMQNTMSRFVDYDSIQTTESFGRLLEDVRGSDPEGYL